MSRLPVSSTITQALAVLAAYPGKLLLWTLAPLSLSLVAAALGWGLLAVSQAWWTVVPFGILILFFWMPYIIRVNQLTVLGKTEPGGYFEKIFDPQSRLCFRYVLLTSLMFLGGMAMSAAPALMLFSRQGGDPPSQALGLAILVGMALFLAFLILFAPFNLIFPAVSVEASPAFGRAYSLGATDKLRLFLAMTAIQFFFAVLSVLVDGIGGVFGGSDKMPQVLVLAPLHLLLMFVGKVLNMIVPATAYRFLRNIPDPLTLPDLEGAPLESAAFPSASNASATPEAHSSAEEPKKPQTPTTGEG